MDLEQLQKNLQTLDVWEVLIPIIDKNTSHIERLNREQLLAGKTADNKDTRSHSGSIRSRKYVNTKIQRGVYDSSIYPHVNLYNEGDFQRKIKAQLDMMFGVYVESYDAKAEMLEERYGSHIYGLNDESLKKFVDLIIDDFRTALLKEISK